MGQAAAEGDRAALCKPGLGCSCPSVPVSCPGGGGDFPLQLLLAEANEGSSWGIFYFPSFIRGGGMMAVEGSCCVVLVQLLAELLGVPLQVELPPPPLLCCCSGLRVPVTQLGEAPEPTRCAVV